MKWAVYRLQQNSPSFDCLSFMQMALDRGAEGIWIVNGFCGWIGYGKEAGEAKRVETIIKPIMKLYGIEHKFADSPPTHGDVVVWPEHGMSDHAAHSMRYTTILKKPFPLMPTQEALDKVWDKFGGRKRMVLSVRACNYQQGRNTDPGQIKWAEERDAVIIPDDLSVSLDERVAHYEHASLTVGVASGNMMPVVFSEHRPYMLTKQINEEYKATQERYFRQHNMPVGFQFPWSKPNQMIMWNHRDSYEETRQAYAEYLDGQNLP